MVTVVAEVVFLSHETDVQQPMQWTDAMMMLHHEPGVEPVLSSPCYYYCCFPMTDFDHCRPNMFVRR